MSETRKVFIGSSIEAIKVAKRVSEVIANQLGMEFTPVLWNNTDAFPSGQTLLETIEDIPNEYDGVILLWTPDVSCKRKDHDPFKAPVANVIFEYGYLAARLGRTRVAICKFPKADILSDLKGMKFITFPNFEMNNPPPLPENIRGELCDWLEKLPHLAAGFPPISQVHGYSGTWNVQNCFSRWRGLPVKKNDEIYFDGKTFLVLKSDGRGGSGIQIGHLYIFVGDYAATYEIVNEVLQAYVDDDGTLKLHVKVIRRQRIDEHGEPPSGRFRAELANKEFDLELHRGREKSKTLKGSHEYKRAGRAYQEAEETFVYHGLFTPPSL